MKMGPAEEVKQQNSNGSSSIIFMKSHADPLGNKNGFN